MPTTTVFVVGAGHVGAAVVELASWLGYRVVVWDDRADQLEAIAETDVVEVASGGIAEAIAAHGVDEHTRVVMVTRNVRARPRVVAAAVGLAGADDRPDGQPATVGDHPAGARRGRRRRGRPGPGALTHRCRDQCGDPRRDRRVDPGRARRPRTLVVMGSSHAFSLLGRGFSAGTRFREERKHDLTPPLVVVRGGGDLATGVVWRLTRAGARVLVTELAEPLTVRRSVSRSRRRSAMDRSTSRA